jgi:hypothetical protein
VQHVYPRLVPDLDTVLGKGLAPAFVPFVQAKGQRIGRHLVQALVVGAQRVQALDRVDDLDGQRSRLGACGDETG